MTKRLANERWRGKEVELRLELNALRKDATAPDDRAYETLRAYLQDNLKVVCMRAAFELATQCVALHQGGKKRTNAVQAEWNIPLRKWIHKWKRAQSVEAIKVDPPSYEVMYECFCLYIVKSMSHEQDGGKMGTFQAFFESRVLWMFNLDALQVEDKTSYCLTRFVYISSTANRLYRRSTADTR